MESKIADVEESMGRQRSVPEDLFHAFAVIGAVSKIREIGRHFHEEVRTRFTRGRGPFYSRAQKTSTVLRKRKITVSLGEAETAASAASWTA